MVGNPQDILSSLLLGYGGNSGAEFSVFTLYSPTCQEFTLKMSVSFGCSETWEDPQKTFLQVITISKHDQTLISVTIYFHTEGYLLNPLWVFFFFWLPHTACEMLVPGPGFEPVSLAVKALSLSLLGPVVF